MPRSQSLAVFRAGFTCVCVCVYIWFFTFILPKLCTGISLGLGEGIPLSAAAPT